MAMSPVLLDHRSLSAIIAGLVFGLVTTFFIGYFAGVHHEDARLPRTIDHVELNLPATRPEPDRSKAVKPAVVAPGANIDVDVPDASVKSSKNSHHSRAKAKTRIISPSAHKSVAKARTVKKHDLAEKKPAVGLKQTVKTTLTKTLASKNKKHVAAVSSKPAEAKPATTVPSVAQKSIDAKPDAPAKSTSTLATPDVNKNPGTNQNAVVSPVSRNTNTNTNTNTTTTATTTTTTESVSIQPQPQGSNDVSKENARFSIQIGIYGSLNNASKQVEKLVAQHLNGYYEAYKNDNNQDRYRVRFGYFATRGSAQNELDNWKKSHPSSFAYVVQLLH